MINDIEYKNRQLIPRWIPYRLHSILTYPQSTDLEPANKAEALHLSHAESDWKRFHTSSFAIELAATALMLGQIDTLDVLGAVNYIKENTTEVSKNPSIAKLLTAINATHVPRIDRSCPEPGVFTNSEISSTISDLRRRLRFYPTDALRWIDLAFTYTIAGVARKAANADAIAISLAANNTYVLRCAARFLVHMEEPDKALFLLRSAPISKNPSLLAAEISISEAFRLKSRFVKEARMLVDSGDFSAHDLNEINATLSTLEFNSGNVKKGKRLLKSALLQPGENTLAQAQFLAKKFVVDFDVSSFNTPCKFEASARSNYLLEKYDRALIEASDWFYFQPFTLKAAMLSSYISSVLLDQNTSSIELLNLALRVSPSDPSLCNNMAFSLARLGRTDEALHVLSHVSLETIDEDQRAVIRATQGLIKLRQRKREDGERLYNEAIEYFTRIKDDSRISRAHYFYASEMLAFDDDRANNLIRTAFKVAKKGNVHDMLYLIKKNSVRFK